MPRSDRLAVVVERARTQRVLDALAEEGVVDEERSVRAWDEATVAVPVTEPPESVEYREVVREVGEPRLRTLEDHLRERGWTDEEVERAPGSWAVVGDVVLVEMGDAPRPTEVAEALRALHGGVDTVLDRGPVTGPHREPDVTVLAGSGDTETVHYEHGTAYALDLARVMFSPGNKAERARMGEVVETGERVLDMFAGVGYFTLPMARAGADVTAVEHNPEAFRYLVENAQLNDVGERVHPYLADCRDVLDAWGGEADVDRVVMGYYDATEPGPDRTFPYLEGALSVVAPGGVLHVHEATPNDLVPDRPRSRVREAARASGRRVEVLATRRVKSYSEGVAHVVLDVRVDESGEGGVDESGEARVD